MVRPLVFLDFEADGPGEADPATDRIVQAALMRLELDGDSMSKTRIIHPGQHFVPLRRSEIHGVTDEMIAGRPMFKDIARGFHEQLGGADIATYNGSNYDVLLLWEEFFRAGIIWDVKEHNFVDVSTLWRVMEPRTLGDAFRRFTGKEPPEGMHDGAVDNRCTCEVLNGMLKAWPLAGRTIEELAKQTIPTQKIGGEEMRRIDIAGVLVRDSQGNAVFSHKQVRGRLLRDDFGYARWILGKDFSENTKMIIREEMKRIEDQARNQQTLPFE